MERPNVVRDRTCRQCGKVFPGGPRAWYCPACRQVRRKEANARYQAKGRKADRPIGSTDKCVRCGKAYNVNSARQRYCPDCAYEGTREADRPASKAWNQAHKATYYPQRNAKRRAARAAAPEPIRQKENAYWAAHKDKRAEKNRRAAQKRKAKTKGADLFFAPFPRLLP